MSNHRSNVARVTHRGLEVMAVRDRSGAWRASYWPAGKRIFAPGRHGQADVALAVARDMIDRLPRPAVSRVLLAAAIKHLEAMGAKGHPSGVV